MAKGLTLTLAQINPTVGALSSNKEQILHAWKIADEAKSDLVIFPELVLCGYSPEDLVLKPFFLQEVRTTVKSLCKDSVSFGCGALISCPWVIDEQTYNAVLLIENGEIKHVQAKHHLPNYGVFDEKRVFTEGPMPQPIEFRGTKLGLLICEDMWHADVALHLKAQGAEHLISTNASPFFDAIQDERIQTARMRVQDTDLPLTYVNLVGGQDEVVFDGGSFVMNADGDVIRQLPFFEDAVSSEDSIATSLSTQGNIYKALTLGLHDYVAKNGFPGVLIGLSGGVDSALAAVIAVDALGADKVHCVMMPSRYTSQDSLEDAAELAENLGCSFETISIADAMDAFEGTIPNLDGLAHENMQSRSRGLILMALSNSTGKMVVSTGNKSEMAVGYATLYGDMCGGFNALKDLYKMQVYTLCEWRNAQGAIIPERIITKAPTAELRDNQTDQDSLPEYKELDDILECLIEQRMDADSICARGHDKKTVLKVWNMLDRAEYKRRQAPPGVKVTKRAFGRERRMPITNSFYIGDTEN